MRPSTELDRCLDHYEDCCTIKDLELIEVGFLIAGVLSGPKAIIESVQSVPGMDRVACSLMQIGLIALKERKLGNVGTDEEE